jgi:hypothetical protein
VGFFLEHFLIHAHFLHFAVFRHVLLLPGLVLFAFLLAVKLREKLLVAFLNSFQLSWLDLVALADSAGLLFGIALAHFNILFWAYGFYCYLAIYQG